MGIHEPHAPQARIPIKGANVTTWIFAFLFAGSIHATGIRMSEQECREMLAQSDITAVCINGQRPIQRIYKDKQK